MTCYSRQKLQTPSAPWLLQRQKLCEVGPCLGSELAQAACCILVLHYWAQLLRLVCTGESSKVFPMIQLTFFALWFIPVSKPELLLAGTLLRNEWMCTPAVTPAAHLHPPPLTEGMPLQAVTQTTAYFRSKTAAVISKHLVFNTQVFLKSLVTCMK